MPWTEQAEPVDYNKPAPHVAVISFGLYECWLRCSHGETMHTYSRTEAHTDAEIINGLIERGDKCLIEWWNTNGGT